MRRDFYGYFVEGELAGAISYKKDGQTIDIHRMIVHPSHFRKGIANALLHHLEMVEVEAEKWVVATGAKNDPARRLYEKNGFSQVQVQEVAPGLSLAFFEKNRKKQ